MRIGKKHIHTTRLWNGGGGGRGGVSGGKAKEIMDQVPTCS